MVNKKADKSDDGWILVPNVLCATLAESSVDVSSAFPNQTIFTKSNLCECGELWFSISIKVAIVIIIILLGVSRILSYLSMSEVSFFVQGRGQERPGYHDSRQKET
jgi:hypothetical protein